MNKLAREGAGRESLLHMADGALDVAVALEERVAGKPGDAMVNVLHSLLMKAISTTKAIVLLYAAALPTEAQTLIRVLIELRIDLRMFLKMCGELGVEKTVHRVNDAMMLEKGKQQRASEYAGHDLVEGGISPQRWMEIEQGFSETYGKEEARKMARFGFSAKSIEDRAEAVELGDLYGVVYRNFSRNVHGIDYMEQMRAAGRAPITKVPDYEGMRDRVALSTTIRCLLAILHQVNGVLGCGAEEQIEGKVKETLSLKEWVPVP
jgi:hypothetical protein